MERSSTNKNNYDLLSHEVLSLLDIDVVDIDFDEQYIYAACSDCYIRVFSKSNWQLVSELGETDTEPLGVDVDDEQVYATCDRRVYVWKKETVGMIGWFELSYQAVTSSLQGDYFFVGAKEGRLVSIQKDTHETSSWHLHKSDITSIWSDDQIICTSTKKEEPRIWLKESNSAPSEIARFDKKGGVVSGNSEFVFVGTQTGEVEVYDRTDWTCSQTFEAKNGMPISSMWASDYYLVVASASEQITLWDIKREDLIGNISLNGAKIEYIIADHDLLYIASSVGLHVIRVYSSGHALDLTMEGQIEWKDGLLKTSPYDVLEEVLEREREGDAQFQEGQFHKAVTEYENAMRLLIDNTHALQEVPKERQLLTDELNIRLGKALLKAKIQELDKIILEIKQLSDELKEKKQTEKNPEDVNRLWTAASRLIKESTNLAEAQSDDMLSYQLTHVVETLKEELSNAMAQYDKFRETINTAISLTRQISNEWRLIERKRTGLNERKVFLEKAIERLKQALEDAESESEVEQILTSALDEYTKIFDQIDRILASHNFNDEGTFSNSDEASAAIEVLLSIIPKKRQSLKEISNPDEFEKEYNNVIKVLNQAIETAKNHKLAEEIKKLESEFKLLQDIARKSEYD